METGRELRPKGGKAILGPIEGGALTKMTFRLLGHQGHCSKSKMAPRPFSNIGRAQRPLLPEVIEIIT